MIKLTNLLLIFFSCLRLYSQISLDEHTVADDLSMAISVCSSDMDNDSDNDLVYCSYADNIVAWYENINGEGSFGPRQIISDTSNYAYCVVACDVDNDGDNDVFAASRMDNTLALYKNTGSGSFSGIVISDSANSVPTIYACDIDNDNDMDLIAGAWGSDRIDWYENTDGYGTFSAPHPVSNTADGVSSVYAGDIDADGDLDIVAGLSGNGVVKWYENTDGEGTFGGSNFVQGCAQVMDVKTADVNSDGHLDVLAASYENNTIAWYENIDGSGTFGLTQVISNVQNMARSVFPRDMDQDGDVDVLSTSAGNSEVCYFENTDSLGTFGPAQLVSDSSGAQFVIADYINQDGAIDIIVVGNNHLSWFENNKDNSFGPLQVIDVHQNYANPLVISYDSPIAMKRIIAYYNDSIFLYGNPNQAFEVPGHTLNKIMMEDIDNDGNEDLVCMNSYEIFWFKNTAQYTHFDPVKRVLVSYLSGLFSDFDVTDVDNNGENDLVWATNHIISNTDDTSRIGWTKLSNNATLQNSEYIYGYIASNRNINCLAAQDMVGDGNEDLVFSRYYGGSIGYYRNINNEISPYFYNITESVESPKEFVLTDISGNGNNNDIIVADGVSNKIYIPNLPNGLDSVSFSSSTRAINLHAVDMNQDGAIDILSNNFQNIEWFANSDGQGSFADGKLIFEKDDYVNYCIWPMDKDYDGDIDILVATSDTLGWIENVKLTVDQSPEDQRVCRGEYASFYIGASDFTNLQWQVDTGTGFYDINNNLVTLEIHTDSIEHAYVRCIVNNSEVNQQIVSDVAEMITDSIIIPDAGADTTLCSTDVLVLQGNNPHAYSGYWTTNDSLIAIADTTQNQTTASGFLTGETALYWSINSSACGIFTDTVIVTKYDSVKLVTQPISQSIEPDSQAVLWVDATGDVLSYQWQKDGIGLADGSNINGAQTDSLIISNFEENYEGVYNCVVTGYCNELITDEVNLDVLVSVLSQTSGKIDVYPNPVGKKLNIELNSNVNWNVKLCNVLGKTVFDELPSSNTAEIDVSDYPSGTYILIIEYEGKIYKEKILVF